MFNKIGVFGKNNGIESWQLIEQLLIYFKNKPQSVFLDGITCKDFPKKQFAVEILDRTKLLTTIDLAIVVGGDGTFLSVAREVVDQQIPILGVNLGRLGFLTDISPELMCATLDEVFTDNYKTEQRNLLQVEIKNNKKMVFKQVAFNDVVLHKNNSLKMIEFEVFIDNRFFNSQRSDGLIIATPTGSTAYSLSAGGPILDPNLNAILLISINPHTMNNRPVVIDGNSTTVIKPHDNCNGRATIMCDGQVNFPFEAGYEVIISHHPKFITMIHPKKHDHYQLLRAKLHWGHKL